jgi:hypothetical protein
VHNVSKILLDHQQPRCSFATRQFWSSRTVFEVKLLLRVYFRLLSFSLGRALHTKQFAFPTVLRFSFSARNVFHLFVSPAALHRLQPRAFRRTHMGMWTCAWQLPLMVKWTGEKNASRNLTLSTRWFSFADTVVRVSDYVFCQASKLKSELAKLSD